MTAMDDRQVVVFNLWVEMTRTGGKIEMGRLNREQWEVAEQMCDAGLTEFRNGWLLQLPEAKHVDRWTRFMGGLAE